MKRLLTTIIALVAALALQPSASAQPRHADSTKVDVTQYADELGYFQKANRDLSDPRFMFHDDVHNMDMGIGGTAKVATIFGFGGVVDAYNFTPASITVPTDYSTQFFTLVSGSEMHFKTRAYLGDHKMIAYMKVGARNDFSIGVSQVYISLDGFSFGLIPTFFTDLEAGVVMYLCDRTLSDYTQPLIGYTKKFGKGWEVAIAAERSNFDADGYGYPRVGYNYPRVPNISGHVKLRGDWGHVQLSGVLREMTYWADDIETGLYENGKSEHVKGYGLTLSGNLKPSDRLLFSWSILGGKGIGQYLGYFSSSLLDLGLDYWADEKYPVIKTLPLMSESFSAQFNATDRLKFSTECGFARSYRPEGLVFADNLKKLTFLTAGMFYDLSDFSYCGLEYLYGSKEVYANNLSTKETNPNKGHANRLAVILAYQF